MRRSEPVSALPGVGEKRARALHAMGIQTINDLLLHFPRDYDDRSEVKTVSMLIPGAVGTIRGFIAYEPENISFARKNSTGGKPLIMTKARLRDHTGELELIWFNQPYLKKYFIKDQEYIFTGRVAYNYNRLQMESPDYEKWCGDDTLSGGRIVPLYTTSQSISQKTFRGFIKNALQNAEAGWPDDLPSAVRQTNRLLDYEAAIRHIHFPENDSLFLAARRRLVFEELFFMQSALFTIKGATASEPGVILTDPDYEPFTANLPYRLTNAQISVLDTLARDMRSGGRMNRLIQGDVGSGKTAVAMAAAYLVIKNGWQAAIMAPTEVLAEQHYKQFSHYFAPLGIETVLLTGSLLKKKRTETLAAIAEGRAGMVVGTHALIQTAVVYNRLALVITDEQHRFGVNQRTLLSKKGAKPHALVMTATPIPRTLGLILYGDMDISIINEMPPGRQAIKTYCVGPDYRARLIAFMKKEISQGRQVYAICPAIEESAAETENTNEPDVRKPSRVELANVTRYTRELADALPGISVAALHGRMKAAEKQTVMDDFLANRVQLIVATTVIEVGVHVANATLIVIENADHFGLSQLHQLRGRVGRGDTQSYCVLITDTRNEQTRARMKAMTQTTDGFALSEMDLQLRGAGDFFGVRQHGLPSFTIANLYRDMEILNEAQTAATEMLQNKSGLPPEEAARYEQRIRAVLEAANGGAAL